MTARRVTPALALVLLVPALAAAAPSLPERRPHPRDLPALPSYVQRVEPAIVGLSVRNAEGALSSARLGKERFGSGVLFDARGYVLTVSYLLLDAVAIEARLRDGRKVPARVVGLDLETGLGVVRLEGAGPWPAAALSHSTEVVVGTRTATVGVDEDGDLVPVPGAIHAIQRFSASWEYMLERALIVAPASPQWGGSAVVNDRGEVIGIASLQLGEAPHVNLAIPTETFLPVQDELIATGRIASRPPRPWLGLYTVDVRDGLVVSDVSPVGPAARAGFLKGDHILRVDGAAVASQEEFYTRLWARRAGDRIEVVVQRRDRVHVIAVTAIDRHTLYRIGDAPR
jgi:S1-C subfamily serine protease